MLTWLWKWFLFFCLFLIGLATSVCTEDIKMYRQLQCDFWQENVKWSLTICGRSLWPASLFSVIFHTEMLTLRCCVADWERREWLPPFYSLWPLNRPFSWTHGLLERFNDGKPFAFCSPCHVCFFIFKYSVPFCLHLFVLLKRSLDATLANIMKIVRAPRTRDSAKNLENCQGLGMAWSQSWILWIFRNFIFFLEFLRTYMTSNIFSKAMPSSLPFKSFPHLASIVSRPLSLYNRK
jgi:hypothetical protein